MAILTPETLNVILYTTSGGITGALITLAVFWTRLNHVESQMKLFTTLLNERTDHGPTIAIMSNRLATIERLLYTIQKAVINKMI